MKTVPLRVGPSQVLLIAAAILLSACVVGPRYGGPPRAEKEVPPAFKNHWKVAEPADATTRGRWWNVFRDPILDQIEEQTIAGNQDLRIAVARISEARAQARVAAADFFPTLDVNARAMRERTSNTLPFQKGELIGSNPFGSTTAGEDTPTVISTQPLTTIQNDFRVPAELNWEIDLFGRVRHEYAAARALAESQVADLEAMRLSVTANVAATYFMLRALDAELDVLDRTVSARQDALRIASERLQAGLTSELDVTRARADLAADQASGFQVQRSRAEMENALATLIGRPASELQMPRRPLAGVNPRIPVGLPSDLLERRPDIASAERMLAAANERIGVATAAFFPRIRLTGAGGFESADIGLLFNAESRFWQIGPSVSLPIFEGGRNVANLRAARVRYEEALGQYRKQLLVAFQEVENALVDLRTLSGQAEAQARVVTAARRAYDLSQQQYQKGASNYLDVLDAERTLLQGERAQTALLGQQMQATVQLIKALGGDWG
jgi:multidrug efflux system outer membrane protein